MIITKKEPYTKEEIEKLKEEYDWYIKTVIDIKEKICSAGAHMHYESEQDLLREGSHQEDLWGGGIDTELKIVTFNSFINIRPAQKNPSNEILNPEVREEFEKLTRYFFKEIL